MWKGRQEGGRTGKVRKCGKGTEMNGRVIEEQRGRVGGGGGGGQQKGGIERCSRLRTREKKKRRGGERKERRKVE
ncbi:hypothetical protein Pmani_032785 [Petrolisthes manimaculis]|uniref:Uncharacterized protein n=1 Tax=Petrolisthes manimaculis TaxID=1843537 RepID=A0AAE1NSM7_9EUCA|nr:hypothetical protein Pmani_032785 [Petrolisthes manimaculis]